MKKAFGLFLALMLMFSLNMVFAQENVAFRKQRDYSDSYYCRRQTLFARWLSHTPENLFQESAHSIPEEEIDV